MRVSVIVPVYNTQQYLEKCVDSLLNQTHRDLQIILVNDGSTDDSLKLMHELEKKDSRITVIDKEHSGLSLTRNAGLKITSGDYVSFVDSDDWIDTEMYETMLKQINSNNAEAAFCEWTEEYSDGSYDVKGYDGKKQKIMSDEEIVDTFLRETCHLRISSGLLSVKLIHNLEFDSNLQPGEEMYYCFRALCNARKIVYSNIPFYHRYNRLGSISNQNTFRETDIRRAISADMRLQYVKENLTQHLDVAYNHCIKYYETVLNYMIYWKVMDQYEETFQYVNKRIQKIFNEVDKPWKNLDIGVILAYKIYLLSPKLYRFIIKIYYEDIKKEFSSARIQKIKS